MCHRDVIWKGMEPRAIKMIIVLWSSQGARMGRSWRLDSATQNQYFEAKEMLILYNIYGLNIFLQTLFNYKEMI